MLACDFRDMQADVLVHLHKESNNRTTVYEDEPLCGIYTAVDLAKLATATLIKHSMKYAQSLLSVHRLPVPDVRRPTFHNYTQM